MKIELINCTPKTYRSEDGKDMVVMNAALTMDVLAAKLNEVIRHVNGLEVSVEALSHSIPPKQPEISISEIIQREDRFQEMRIHFGKAIQMLKAIASGEAPDGHPDCRKDPRFTTGGISGVRLLAEIAMDELEKALGGANALHQPQNKGTENENN